MDINQMTELEIVKHLKARGVRISVIQNFSDIRLNIENKIFEHVVTDGLVFESELSNNFLHNVYEIEELINDPGDKFRKGMRFKGAWDETSKLISVSTPNEYRGYTAKCECVLVNQAQDYKEYLKSIDPEILRSDYKKSYYKLVEKYQL